MNTLQLIKARTVRNQAIETARTQMARAFRHQEHTDQVHTPVAVKAKVLRYRGVAYETNDAQQVECEWENLVPVSRWLEAAPYDSAV